jgi:hypothetical protein
MKQENQIEKFIELRIDGKSFDAIAKELHTSKHTLLEWNKEVKTRNAVDEGKTLKINSIVKSYGFDLQNRLSGYLELSQRINDELSKRDLTTVNTETLLKMSIGNDERIKSLVNKNFEFGINKSIWEIGVNDDGYFKMSLDE